MNRRDFLKASGAIAMLPSACATGPPLLHRTTLVNDIHSQLNSTEVRTVLTPKDAADLLGIVKDASRTGKSISIAGGRHAMGGQQFGTGTTLLDMRSMNRVLGFDRTRGTIELEAGIQWPELASHLLDTQKDGSSNWGFAQKQTGADRLTLGGAVAANVHGRGLRMKPFIQDVEALEIVTSDGRLIRCSRSENAELFALAVGGYGLFGIVSKISLRLTPRRKVRRDVVIQDIATVSKAFEERIADGYLYGDFQFAIDDASDDFMRKGVFACYKPVDESTPIAAQRELKKEDWIGLLSLAHSDKSGAFDRYASYYLATSGQVYWSDTQQMGYYPDDYHRSIDQSARATDRATEVITEIYVPRDRLADFMLEARDDFRRSGVPIIYGTVRLIEKDDESFLAWAKQPYACVIFNLHTVHTPDGIARSAGAFRRLIDMAIARSGSYYLTYHRFARREQVETCYPQFAQFLQKKKEHDPRLLFQSDWYRNYAAMFGG
ncbi:MAG TPA: FAD-binding oxidoreductase [Thermoanaerobaculia bacterium]|nr:FAD-binding oxidoreductase [Thermoanaerobaculia bacterium]